MITGVVSANHLFIGRGYNIFTGSWADQDDVSTGVIIDRKKMAKRGYDIEFQKDARALYTVHTGKTLKELTESTRNIVAGEYDLNLIFGTGQCVLRLKLQGDRLGRIRHLFL